MQASNKTARIVGVLFIAVMVTWFVGYMLIDSVLGDPEYLVSVIEKENVVIIGVLIEIIEVMAIVGLVVLMYPFLRKGNESMALGYVSLKILECVLLVSGALIPLVIITLGKGSAQTGAIAQYQSISATLLEVREHWAPEILAIFYAVAAVVFFRLLYLLRIVPRFISVAGFIGAVPALIGSILGFFGFQLSMITGLPMGLIEIFLGMWLIVRGFATTSGISVG